MSLFINLYTFLSLYPLFHELVGQALKDLPEATVFFDTDTNPIWQPSP